MLLPLGILASAGGAADFELITTSTVSGSSVSSVVFNSSSAWANYKHLQIRWAATETTGGDIDSLLMRFNGDTAANYAWHDLRGINSSATSNSGASTSNAFIGFITGLGTSSAKFGSGVIDILDFANTSKTKTSRSLSGAVGTTDKGVTLKSTLWNNTAAITSIVLSGASGNLDVGSRFSLYGLKG